MVRALLTFLGALSNKNGNRHSGEGSLGAVFAHETATYQSNRSTLSPLGGRMLDRFGFAGAKQPLNNEVRTAHAEILNRVKCLLSGRDVRACIEYLNLRSGFRFTKIGRFDPPIL